MTMETAGVLSRRTLNRTLMQRQFLDERSSRPAGEVVRQLVAMQGQERNCPHVGLWSRVAGFRAGDLDGLLSERAVLRCTLLRGTQHLASAEVLGVVRAAVQPVLDRMSRSSYRRLDEGPDAAEVAAVGRELLGGRTVPRRELSRQLAEAFPGLDGRVLTAITELRSTLVHAPDSAGWGAWGSRPVVLDGSVRVAEPGIGDDPVGETLQRYLAAFGPASVKDMQRWSGLTRLREVVEGMREGLVRYVDEQGVELFDLPGARLADPELPVPVRFLPAFDNLVLSHEDRSRVIADADRAVVMPGRSVVRPTVLVDGFVHAVWELDGDGLAVTPLRRLSEGARDAVREEGEQLLGFLGEAEGRDRAGLAQPSVGGVATENWAPKGSRRVAWRPIPAAVSGGKTTVAPCSVATATEVSQSATSK
jgi:hypothetical protein